jgi:hypothetical protein
MNMHFRGNGLRGGQGAGLISKIPQAVRDSNEIHVPVEGGTKKDGVRL